MGWQIEGKCLVAGEKVQEALPRMGDSIELISPTLGRYRVSGSAAETRSELAADESMRAFERAKERAPAGEIPLINTYNFDAS